MKKYNLWLLAGLISGSIMHATVAAETKSIGPKPIISTDIAKGTLFVKPNGTGTTCSLALPCDIWNAVLKAKAGDVVFLRGGTYSLYKNLRLSNTGTATAPVIYENYPGELAVFDGSQHAKGTNIYIGVNGRFVHVRGIEIKNMPVKGIWVNGSDNLVDGVYAHHNGLSGIQITTYGDGTGGARNTIRNSTSAYNSGVGIYDSMYSNGGNSDGIAVSTGIDNRIENCLVHHNSDDGIDTWMSVNTYVGYSIAHSNGAGDGDGNGIKGGGVYPSANTVVDHNIAYSNRARGFTNNAGVNVRFTHNTSWNNKMAAFAFDPHTIVDKNIAVANVIKWGTGIEQDNSWQRAGNVVFVSTDSGSADFLKPAINGEFEDIGALVNAEIYRPAQTPDLVISQISYSNGIFTAIVKNQGTGDVPSGITIGVGYFVDGQWKTWGGVWGPLAAGESVTIGTKGGSYVIPSGTHTITAYTDDQNKIPESNENNNKLSKTLTLP
ncbi:hypothetical protein W03_20480 [Nitrosomonas sp. PY1]|uniref:CARDB domain-containing protein n=1 Tax=Nitrosomonas sp. PY1 TaxID=1803906 RepID=UPI001FC82357|nr:right-handed parallel beta-helix repeat-containing protein [Nitrosomonas sp. PY1]GKS70044.1 hypothetical protein W03_20480 [Nitrosomonas sp. PY1]